ncbi:MAG TPA: HEAT repeat domain-containing protein, partial [Holophaga sp.]|nr:HEAT repeat domain-containing protein [Holophaga sp.]
GGPGAGQGLGGPGAGSGPGGPGTGENTEPGSGGLAGQDGSGAGQGAEGSGQGGPASGHPGGQPDLPPGGGIEGLPSGPADLSVLGATMAGAAIGEGMPEAQSLDALRRALHELPPGALLSVVEGLDSLPRNPAGLRMAFTALSPEAFARATAAFLGRGAGRDHRWPQMRDRLHGILQGAADGSPAGPAANLLSALEAELRNRGLGLENIKELVALLEWDKMALDDQIRALEERNNLWALSHQQRLAFLRRILDDGREDTFRRILAQVLQGLESPDPNRREAAARTLVGVAHWLSVPGLPPASEADLLRGLQAHFMAETLPQVHKATVEAFAVAFAQMLARSEPGRAHAMLVDLDRAAAGAADPMRREAMAWLWDRMGQPEALARVFELLHTANPESLLTELIPYLETVGAPAARQLVWVLGEEQDRKRRVRLVEIIRGLGHLALPAMHEALESDRWYLVRNTLNILADLGDADALRPAEACLTHPDGRVRRAAVRTVWKLGGPQAVPALMTAFHQADAETLLEIMFAFGQIRATAAVSLLGVFAQDARMPEKLRARAAETLGLIGGAPAMAILEELLKRKGRIFTTAEPTEVRAGAAKGLASLGTPQAMASLLALVEREPRNADRPIFQEILDQARR